MKKPVKRVKKKFLVTVETIHEEVVSAYSEKNALDRFYKFGEGQFLEGQVIKENVRKAKRYET